MNRKISNLAIAASVLGGTAVGATLVGTAGAYGGDTGADTETETQVETLDLDSGFTPVQDDSGDTPTPEDGDGTEDGRRGHRGGGCNLEAVAEVLGLEEDAVRAELEAGLSIADLAQAQGVAIDEVVDAMLAEKEARLDAKVDDGRLTAEEAEARLAEAEERALDRVNGSDADDQTDA